MSAHYGNASCIATAGNMYLNHEHLRVRRQVGFCFTLKPYLSKSTYPLTATHSRTRKSRTRARTRTFSNVHTDLQYAVLTLPPFNQLN